MSEPRFIIAALLACFLFSGCVWSNRCPDPELAAGLDFGKYPADYKAAVFKHMEQIYYDPYSAVIYYNDEPLRQATLRGQSARQPFFSAFSELPLLPETIVAGYAGYVEINAKDRYGRAYTGLEKRWFLIHNDKVVYFSGPKPNDEFPFCGPFSP